MPIRSQENVAAGSLSWQDLHPITSLIRRRMTISGCVLRKSLLVGHGLDIVGFL